MNEHAPFRLTLVVRAYDDDPEENPDMDDPLVIALAQLVRDRWHNEQRQRARFVLLPTGGEGKADAQPSGRKKSA
jgi:hypothetical protein